MANTVRGRAERLLAFAASSPALSRAVGRLSDCRLPAPLLRALVRGYVRLYRVDLDEAVCPERGYATLGEFFTRRLVEGCRPISREAGTIVSPTDSLLSAVGAVPEEGRLEQIKGSSYSIEALLGSRSDAAAFGSGLHATLYLSPAMYHRVHAPVDGCIRRWRYVPGRLFPVNRLGTRAIPGLFTRNERVCVFIESEEHGAVAVVLVGATNVGRISLAFTDLVTNCGAAPGDFAPEGPIAVRRGDELGAFNLGSTVVMLVADRRLTAAAEPGRIVRVGQPLWRRSK